MTNVKINHREIVDKIFVQFASIKAIDEKYSNLKFYVDDEQSFIKRGTINDRNSIYIVVKFGEATLNSGSSVAPITLLVFGIGNDIELTQAFLQDYATNYNLARDDKMQFVFSSPYAMANFNETGYDFRALFSISGSILVGNTNSIFIDYIEYKGEKINIIDFNDDTTNNLNPQVYGNTYGRTKSYATFQSYTFCISIYALDNILARDILDVKYSNKNTSNKEFTFTLKFNNGSGFTNWTFKLKNATFISKMGQLPVFSLTFAL